MLLPASHRNLLCVRRPCSSTTSDRTTATEQEKQSTRDLWSASHISVLFFLYSCVCGPSLQDPTCRTPRAVLGPRVPDGIPPPTPPRPPLPLPPLEAVAPPPQVVKAQQPPRPLLVADIMRSRDHRTMLQRASQKRKARRQAELGVPYLIYAPRRRRLHPPLGHLLRSHRRARHPLQLLPVPGVDHPHPRSLPQQVEVPTRPELASDIPLETQRLLESRMQGTQQARL